MSIWIDLKDLLNINCLIIFFNSLKGKYISKEEYNKAINTWDKFKKKTLGEYHDLFYYQMCLKSLLKNVWSTIN